MAAPFPQLNMSVSFAPHSTFINHISPVLSSHFTSLRHIIALSSRLNSQFHRDLMYHGSSSPLPLSWNSTAVSHQLPIKKANSVAWVRERTITPVDEVSASFADRGCHVVWRIPTVVFSAFWAGAATFSFK
jgi:hypothetical protein